MKPYRLGEFFKMEVCTTSQEPVAKTGTRPLNLEVLSPFLQQALNSMPSTQKRGFAHHLVIIFNNFLEHQDFSSK